MYCWRVTFNALKLLRLQTKQTPLYYRSFRRTGSLAVFSERGLKSVRPIRAVITVTAYHSRADPLLFKFGAPQQRCSIEGAPAEEYKYFASFFNHYSKKS